MRRSSGRVAVVLAACVGLVTSCGSGSSPAPVPRPSGASGTFVGSSGGGPFVSAFMSLIVPVGVAIGVVLLVRRLRSGRAARPMAPGPVPPPPIDVPTIAPGSSSPGFQGRAAASPEAVGASAARRLVAAVVNWVVAGVVIGSVFFVRHAFIGWALIVGPFVVFTVGAAVGAGVGEAVAGLRIRDAATGGRLRVPLAAVRSLVQLVVSYAASMAGLLVGLIAYYGVVTVIGARSTEGGAGSVGLGAAAAGPPIAEALLVRAARRRNAPWDYAAGSVVARRA